jgi:hypothetical protein
MSRNLLLTLLCSISFSTILPAQFKRVTPCGYIIPPRSFKNQFQSVYEAKQVVNNMLDTIQWKQNFNLREQNGIQNAYATILSGQRYIVYDNSFLEDIDSYAKTKWASMSIMAHEMGHHYYNHVVSSSGSTVPKEIEADAFSGYVMEKMGATLQQALAAMTAIGTDQQTSTHPAKADRLAAITRGWNAARGVANTTANTGNNPAPSPVPTQIPKPSQTPAPVSIPPVNTNVGGGATGNAGNQTDPQSDPSWIALSIQSNKDETVQLSDDGRTYQSATLKAGQSFIFKFEVYQWGWLRLPYYNGYRTFKLLHAKDYSILYNRRSKNWTVVEVPE